jgi:outer membrane receptor protein involved in Fe transport
VKFRNSGSLKTIGAEIDATCQLPVFRVRFTASCQWPLSASDYYYQQNHIFSVPLAEAKLQAAVRLFGRGNHNLWLTTALNAATKTLEKASPHMADSQPYYQHGRVLADIGLRYQPTKIIQLAIDVDNLLNTTYYVGGTTYFPYQRPGRTAMATLSLKF